MEREEGMFYGVFAPAWAEDEWLCKALRHLAESEHYSERDRALLLVAADRIDGEKQSEHNENVWVPRDSVEAVLDYVEYLQSQVRSLGIGFTHDGPGPRTKPLYIAVNRQCGPCD